MKKVTAVKANQDFSLDLKFNDGTVRRFDVKPYLDSHSGQWSILLNMKVVSTDSKRFAT